MEKLSIKSLQIGDWVYDTLSQTNIKVNGGCFETNPLNGIRYAENLIPIPLTPEILEKNGFVANKPVYPYPYYEYTNEEGKVKVGFAFPQGNRTSYKEPWVYIDSENVFIEHLPCIFVHQLQQALRLCGIEKTIEL